MAGGPISTQEKARARILRRETDPKPHIKSELRERRSLTEYTAIAAIALSVVTTYVSFLTSQRQEQRNERAEARLAAAGVSNEQKALHREPLKQAASKCADLEAKVEALLDYVVWRDRHPKNLLSKIKKRKFDADSSMKELENWVKINGILLPSEQTELLVRAFSEHLRMTLILFEQFFEGYDGVHVDDFRGRVCLAEYQGITEDYSVLRNALREQIRNPDGRSDVASTLSFFKDTHTRRDKRQEFWIEG